jgi:hypothetical protein
MQVRASGSTFSSLSANSGLGGPGVREWFHISQQWFSVLRVPFLPSACGAALIERTGCSTKPVQDLLNSTLLGD